MATKKDKCNYKDKCVHKKTKTDFKETKNDLRQMKTLGKDTKMTTKRQETTTSDTAAQVEKDIMTNVKCSYVPTLFVLGLEHEPLTP